MTDALDATAAVRAAAFERNFADALDAAARWLGARRTRSACDYGEFGDWWSGGVRFLLQRTRLLPALLGAGPTDVALIGVHLKQIAVPVAYRRRGYASRVLDRLLVEARAAGLDYVLVESVITEEMHALMRARSEFALVPHGYRDCYVARLLE